MPSKLVYDLLYRLGAARWERGWEAGVGPEIRALVESGSLSPETVGGNRAVDLGCGSGDNALFLAESGFEVVGVDFSEAAVRQARRKAARAATPHATFVAADITRPLDGVQGPFDLVVLYNVVQDVRGDARKRVADVAVGLAGERSTILVWCWYARRSDLPLISYRGPSRIAPFVVEPGEERTLFGDGFVYSRPEPQPGDGKAMFLLTRRPS